VKMIRMLLDRLDDKSTWFALGGFLAAFGVSVEPGLWEAISLAGVGLATGQGQNADIRLRWSDDGGRTWSNWYTKRLGVQGRYSKRVRFRRLGRFRERSFGIGILRCCRTS